MARACPPRPAVRGRAPTRTPRRLPGELTRTQASVPRRAAGEESKRAGLGLHRRRRRRRAPGSLSVSQPEGRAPRVEMAPVRVNSTPRSASWTPARAAISFTVGPMTFSSRPNAMKLAQYAVTQQGVYHRDAAGMHSGITPGSACASRPMRPRGQAGLETHARNATEQRSRTPLTGACDGKRRRMNIGGDEQTCRQVRPTGPVRADDHQLHKYGDLQETSQSPSCSLDCIGKICPCDVPCIAQEEFEGGKRGLAV